MVESRGIQIIKEIAEREKERREAGKPREQYEVRKTPSPTGKWVKPKEKKPKEKKAKKPIEPEPTPPPEPQPPTTPTSFEKELASRGGALAIMGAVGYKQRTGQELPFAPKIKESEKIPPRTIILTKQQYQQELWQQQALAGEYGGLASAQASQLRGTSFDPLRTYILTTSEGKVMQVPGAVASVIFLKEADVLETKSKELYGMQSDIMKQYHATSPWHPETKITKKTTDSGMEYVAEFPYAGAEKYYTYKKQLSESGFAGLFATAFSAEDFLGIPSAVELATGDKQKALDIKIKALHGIKSKDFFSYYITSPMGIIGTSAMVGGAIGIGSKAATGYLATRYGAGSLATWGFHGLQAGIGGAFLGYTAADIQKTFEREGLGAGFGAIAKTGTAIASGYAGYKTLGSATIKGATPYEWGARKGFKAHIDQLVKTGQVTPEKGAMVKEIADLEFKLRQELRFQKPTQTMTPEQLAKVQTLKDQPGLRAFFQRHLLRRKSGVFGSLSEGKEDIHDIDVMYRNLSQGARESSFAASKLTETGDIKAFADIKPWQKTDQVVGRMGTQKQPWYKTEEGYNLMRLSESAMRHGESALELAHAGRAKDIPRAVELYTKLYEHAGKPSHLQPTLARYTELMGKLELDPLIMSPEESMFVYGGKSFTERWAGFKTKIYEKYAPESWAKKSFQKTMGMEIKPTYAPYTQAGGIPPSPSVSPVGISPSIISASIGGLTPSIFVDLPSPSKSLSISGISPTAYPSISEKPKPSISKKISSPKTVIPSASLYPFESDIVSPYISPRISPRISPVSYPTPYPSISKSIFPSTYPSVSPSLYPYSYPSVIPALETLFDRGSLDTTGATDIGFEWTDPFERERKHKYKNILKEIEDFGKGLF